MQRPRNVAGDLVGFLHAAVAEAIHGKIAQLARVVSRDRRMRFPRKSTITGTQLQSSICATTFAAFTHTLRVTPTMEAVIAAHDWLIEAVVSLLDRKNDRIAA
jgi:hypothetical protein